MTIKLIAMLALIGASLTTQAQEKYYTGYYGGQIQATNNGIGGLANVGIDRLIGKKQNNIKVDINVGRFDGNLPMIGGKFEMQFFALQTSDGKKLSFLYSPFCVNLDALQEKIGIPGLAQASARFDIPGAFLQFGIKPTFVGVHPELNTEEFSRGFSPLTQLSLGADITKKLKAIFGAEFGNLNSDTDKDGKITKLNGTSYNLQAGLECKLTDRVFLIGKYELNELSLDQTVNDGTRVDEFNFKQDNQGVTLGVRVKIN